MIKIPTPLFFIYSENVLLATEAIVASQNIIYLHCFGSLNVAQLLCVK
jgi:hypothetical protein